MGWFARLVAWFRGDEPTPEPERLVLPPVPTSADLLAAVEGVEALVAEADVPAPVASRVARVTRVVREAIARLDRLGSGSPQAYSVMATATDYLPEAVGGYLRLPRDWANSRPVDGGRTSLMVLIDQLDLLARTMDQVLDAVNRSDAAALVAHGRFLAEKFGHAAGGGHLEIGPAGPGPGGPGPGATGPGAAGPGIPGPGIPGPGIPGPGIPGPGALGTEGSGASGSGPGEPGRLAPPEQSR